MAVKFAHIAQHMFDVPLVIHPMKAKVIVEALRARMGLGDVSIAGGVFYDDDDDDDMGFSDSRSRRDDDQGYDMVGPVAVIPVQGTLVQRLGTLRPYSGMTGYDGIRQSLFAAMTDPKVEGVAFDIRSPGGEAAGCFDLVDQIYGLRGKKPMAAILAEYAYSGGYAIASAVDPGQIYVPRTGGTGSIGVIFGHVDATAALAKDGYKVTFFTHGSRKAEGKSEVPLTDEAAAAIQDDMDRIGDIFDRTVARNRGMTPAAVAALQAGCFMGEVGLENGLADVVMAPDAAFKAFLKTLN